VTDPHHSHRQLIAGLLGPLGPELSCEECLDLIDVYVEYELADMRADERVPGMRAHLCGCPACAEEHDSLRALLTAPAPEHLGGGTT
jgi:hypothetical protein